MTINVGQFIRIKIELTCCYARLLVPAERKVGVRRKILNLVIGRHFRAPDIPFLVVEWREDWYHSELPGIQVVLCYFEEIIL